MQHIKGNWRIRSGAAWGSFDVLSGYGLVATVWSGARSNPTVGQAETNARLLRSAPDLLAALIALVDAAESPDGMTKHDVEHARKIIARAEGQAPKLWRCSRCSWHGSIEHDKPALAAIMCPLCTAPLDPD